jgi:hypothetical protein
MIKSISKLAAISVIVFCSLLFALCSLLFIPRAEAGIVLKIMGVNPSPTQRQKVVLKAYLPKEVKLEHIIDRGDLNVIYDAEEGAYYVYGEYEVGPKDVVEREVEIEDIWSIPQNELEGLQKEVSQTLSLLEKTEFKERVAFLKESMETKLNEIINNQKVPAVNPQRHISNYRSNLKLLEGVKSDLMLARSLLAQAKPIPSITIWIVFFAIVGFLGVLGLVFYFIWNKQVKEISYVGLESPTKSEEEEIEVKARGGQGEEREIGAEDIEKIMREGKEGIP